MRLIKVPRIAGYAGPVWLRRLACDLAGLAKPQDARKMTRRNAGQFNASAPELANTQISRSSDFIDIAAAFKEAKGLFNSGRWFVVRRKPGRQERARIVTVIQTPLKITDAQHIAQGNDRIDLGDNRRLTGEKSKAREVYTGFQPMGARRRHRTDNVEARDAVVACV
jgi:hypothetical protein